MRNPAHIQEQLAGVTMLRRCVAPLSLLIPLIEMVSAGRLSSSFRSGFYHSNNNRYPPPYRPNRQADYYVPNPYGPQRLPPIAIAHECCEGERNGPEVVYYAAPPLVPPPVAVTITVTRTIPPVRHTDHIYMPPTTVLSTVYAPPVTIYAAPRTVVLSSYVTMVSTVSVTATATQWATDTMYVQQPAPPSPPIMIQQAAAPAPPPLLVRSSSNPSSGTPNQPGPVVLRNATPVLLQQQANNPQLAVIQ